MKANQESLYNSFNCYISHIYIYMCVRKGWLYQLTNFHLFDKKLKLD